MEETMEATTVREEATETIVSEAGATVATTSKEHKRLDQMQKVVLKVIATDCCLLYTSPSPRDQRGSRMPSSA